MLESQPLKDTVGSEVYLDAAAIRSPDVAAELRKLLVQRGVLVFRGAHFSDEDQVALASLMGTLRQEGERGIYKVTLDKKTNARADYLKGSFLWHLDGTQDKVPVFASLLSARKLSETGGQTEFASSYAAYEALSPDIKNRIDGLQVVHSVETSMRRAGLEPTEEYLADWRRIPDMTHSLVWTHTSGRKSLVIGCHAAAIVGMEKSESDSLIQQLLSWTTQPEFVYRHEWTPGDMLIWDNTGVLHRAEPYPLDSGRVMHRTTLMGEEAFS